MTNKMHSKPYIIASLVLSILLAAAPLRAETSPNSLKAAFVTKVLGYVSIPPRSDSSRPLVCTAASDDMTSEILRYLEQNDLDQKIRVRNLMYNRSLDQCWVLYIENEQVRGTSFMLSEARGKGILSIGGEEDFLAKGGMVYLYFANRKLSFDVNKTITDAARIKIDARLLTMARKVER